MIEKSTIQKVLDIFFDNPTKEFHLRELSRLLKFSMPTIVASTDILSREKLIIKTKGKVITKVQADRENMNFIRFKRLHNLENIYKSGVIDSISSLYNNPKNIILFGSYRKGDDDENSDIDIAIEIIGNEEPKIHELGVISKFAYRKDVLVNLHIFSRNKIDINLFSNIANGIVLEGFLEVRP